MAGAAFKKTTVKNKETVEFYTLLHLSLVAIYSLVQVIKFFYELPLDWSLLVLLAINQFIYQQFLGIKNAGGDLSVRGGTVSFMVDIFGVCYLTTVLCSVFSYYFAYLLLLLPIFTIMKLKALYNSFFGSGSPSKSKKAS